MRLNVNNSSTNARLILLLLSRLLKSPIRLRFLALPEHVIYRFFLLTKLHMGLVFAMFLCASVYMYFVVTCWERADLLALVCDV